MSAARLPHITAQARIDTPLGPLTAAATAHGLAGLWFDGQAHHPGELDAPIDDTQRFIAQAREALQHYWQAPAAPAVPFDLLGTPFQNAVWQALLHIAAGRTCSFGVVAARLGRPAAVRAVAAAVGRNPVSLLVPCHRVIGQNGALTGYAGGLARKQALLAHEARR
jgi:methylated-DNA-[protein]-cysteine S-methyltransferase